ncbi:DUF4126 domain-containing protein [Mycobacterium sp. URHB0021]|jgi:uncharacterized protein DUF4126
MELLTGFGLATAAGLNAYIPLLALGLLSRFTDLVTLPHSWAWLENGWVMTVVAALLVVEIVADKIPALDSVNDAIQTFVRPTAGGIVFGSGTAAQTSAVADPGAFAQSGQWIPIAVGVVTALVVSLTKSAVRPAANVATAGMAAPVLSTVEDVASVGLVFLAILIPVLVLVALVALVWAGFRMLRRRRKRRTPSRQRIGDAEPD